MDMMELRCIDRRIDSEHEGPHPASRALATKYRLAAGRAAAQLKPFCFRRGRGHKPLDGRGPQPGVRLPGTTQLNSSAARRRGSRIPREAPGAGE